MKNVKVPGFLSAPKATASGQKYTGRLCCDDVQITGVGQEAIATFTITARQLLDAAESDMIWTDQDVQRGIKPEVSIKVPHELSLRSGYPDEKIYIFHSKNADEMAEKLLSGQQLFINPLVWNMRPDCFEIYSDAHERRIYIYSGKIYLPDSHHRHQAILKAARIVREAPNDYPHFSLEKQFKVEMYFLKKQDEGNYFFDKNQRPTPTPKSKAYDLTTLDDLSLLAKRVIEITPIFHSNVNRVTDRLTAKNPQVVTLSTLREAIKSASDFEELDEAGIEGLAQVASVFFTALHEIRHELGVLDINSRNLARKTSMVDAPVMFLAYGSLISDFNLSMSKFGLSKATNQLEKSLSRLSADVIYSEGNWSGDFFSKSNPMWTRLGVLKPGLTGKPTVNNTRHARLQCIRALRSTLSASGKNLMEIVP